MLALVALLGLLLGPAQTAAQTVSPTAGESITSGPAALQCPKLDQATVDVPYLDVTNSGIFNIFVGSGVLPPGISIDAKTGDLSGTPSGNGGTFVFTLATKDQSSPECQLIVTVPTVDVVRQDVIVAATESKIVAGSLTIADGFSLTSEGSLAVTKDSVLSVSGSIKLTGRASVYLPATISGDSLSLDDKSASLLLFITKEPVVTRAANATAFFVVDVAKYNSTNGKFANVSSVLSYPRSAMSECFDTIDSVPNYGSTTLTVTVVVRTCPSNSFSPTSSGLSTGAIVGIAVGAAVGGVLVAVAMVLTVRYLIHRRTDTMNADIRGNALKAVRS